MIKELESSNFNEFISKGGSVIDFYAEWCGPCKVMAPHFKKVSESVKNVKFGKVDVDGNQDLAQEYGVMSIPTTIFFKNGEPVDRHTGAMDEDDIRDRIKEAF